jgi:hypothetical protein
MTAGVAGKTARSTSAGMTAGVAGKTARSTFRLVPCARGALVNSMRTFFGLQGPAAERWDTESQTVRGTSVTMAQSLRWH